MWLLGSYLFSFGIKGLEYSGRNLKDVISDVLILKVVFEVKMNRDSCHFDFSVILFK